MPQVTGTNLYSWGLVVDRNNKFKDFTFCFMTSLPETEIVLVMSMSANLLLLYFFHVLLGIFNLCRRTDKNKATYFSQNLKNNPKK